MLALLLRCAPLPLATLLSRKFGLASSHLLSAFCARLRTPSSYRPQTAAVPRGADGSAAGIVSVSPTTGGRALVTPFAVTPSGWVIPGTDKPVLYRVSYGNTVAAGQPAAPQTFLTMSASAAPLNTVLLPEPGRITVFITAESPEGVQALAQASANVVVADVAVGEALAGGWNALQRCRDKLRVPPPGGAREQFGCAVEYATLFGKYFGLKCTDGSLDAQSAKNVREDASPRTPRAPLLKPRWMGAS